MSASDQDWGFALDEALALAKESAAEGEVPVGAVVVHEGKIIGRGRNRREQNQDPLSHAELHAISEAAQALGSWRLVGCTLVVTLEPCPMCLGALQQARVEQVIFGALDPKGGALSLGYTLHSDPRTNHRFSVEHHEDLRCGEVLREFFRSRRLRTDQNGKDS